MKEKWIEEWYIRLTFLMDRANQLRRERPHPAPPHELVWPGVPHKPFEFTEEIKSNVDNE